MYKELPHRIALVVSTLLLSGAMRLPAATCDIRSFGAVPGDTALATKPIQSAIDECASKGGGIVLLTGGKYRTGAIRLKSGITLRIEKGSILEGSADWKDYYAQGNLDDCFIKAFDVENVRIEGGGIIDGADCKNPNGEEGFRGPHGVFFKNARNISMADITVRHAGNYNIICRNVAGAQFDKVLVRGGHDGLNAWGSSDFALRECDIRTGDDGIAGTGNKNFTITDCKINSSCNAFRFACLGLTVRRIRIWGPGEFQHQVQKRNNSLAAFVHFSPGSKSPVPVTDDWLIEDAIVDSVTTLYLYDYPNGLWQKGQPVQTVRFNRVKATRIEQPVVVIGDGKASYVFNDVEIHHLLKNVGVERGPTGESDGYAFSMKNAARLELYNVTVSNGKTLTRPVISGVGLGLALLDGFRFVSTTNASPLQVPSEALIQGAAGLWRFDGNVKDSMGTSDGALVGDASLASGAASEGGGYLSTKGGWVNLPQARFKQAFKGYSACFRFWPDNLQGKQVLIEEGGAENGIAVRLNDGALEAMVSGGAKTLRIAKPGVVAGRWNFAAVTLEKGAIKVYLNGGSNPAAIVDTAFAGVGAHDEGLTLGGRDGTSAFSSADAGFIGKLDDVRIYRGVAIDFLRISSLNAAYPDGLSSLVPISSRAVRAGGTFRSGFRNGVWLSERIGQEDSEARDVNGKMRGIIKVDPR